MTLFGGRKLTILFPTFNPISFSIFHLFFILSFPFLKSLHLLFSLHIRRWKWFSTSSNISWQSNFLNTTYTISLEDRKNVTLLVGRFVWATLKWFDVAIKFYIFLWSKNLSLFESLNHKLLRSQMSCNIKEKE